MRAPMIPVHPVAAMRLACDAAEYATAAQSQQPEPDHDDFYAHGIALDGLLRELDGLAITLSDQVLSYGGRRILRYRDRRVLRDDAGVDPADRLELAATHLVELHQALATAAYHATRYCSEIGHVDLAVDTEAGPEDTEADPEPEVQE